jgi:hypothetical protein
MYDEFDEEGMEYADPQEIVEAAQGVFGPEAQAEALDALGLQYDDGDADEGYEDEAGEQEAIDALADEMLRLENHLGRQLTSQEIGKINRGLSQDELYGGPLNLVDRYGEELKGRMDSREGRIQLSAERVGDLQEAERANAPVAQDEDFTPPPVGGYEGGAEDHGDGEQ